MSIKNAIFLIHSNPFRQLRRLLQLISCTLLYQILQANTQRSRTRKSLNPDTPDT